MASLKQHFSALLVLLVLARPIYSEDNIDYFLDWSYGAGSSTNLMEVLHALDVDFVSALKAVLTNPIDKLTKDGDQYTYTSKSTYINIVETFRPDEPFRFTTFDGRSVVSTFSIEGARLHEVQVEDNGRTTIIDRTFSRSQLEVVIKVGNNVAKIVRISLATKETPNAE